MLQMDAIGNSWIVMALICKCGRRTCVIAIIIIYMIEYSVVSDRGLTSNGFL
ncbi:Uncharacterised protein [Mycolicibacterium phlei]|nr:Uncharacterised protein [Mycolicibacterium phlei]